MDKRYNHTQNEKNLQTRWSKENTYGIEHNTGELYAIDTPPPTVSGALHIGHIFSYTQTDIIARYKRMAGFSVFYPFGFDDNGLPTERYIEKKCKTNAFKLGRSEFIKLCLKETREAEEQFKQLWQRMGLSADWRYCYSTISDSVRKLSQASFIDLYNKGFVYRRNEPALYCTTCRTSVAQAELDDIEKEAFFNDIIFKDQNGNDLLISTTRPELLSSCVAMFYHPDDARYKKLAEQKAIVPIFGNEVPILPDEQVDPEKGTGLVMCCTFGDKTDIHWYKKHKLDYKQSIGFDGKWKEHTGILAGLKSAAAQEKILEELKNQNLLVAQKKVTHAVNVHERCKKPIEYVMLQQWFLNILEHKETFLNLANQIEWRPQFMKSRYINWVKNLSWDWCLSRQRYYGIPFPVWHCIDCNTVTLAELSELPIDPQEQSYKACSRCKNTNMRADTDVMDTWNTSSISPYICEQLFNKNDELPFDKPNKFIPMGMRPQAHDIIRTWAFYTIAKTWMHHKTLPWKEIIISGHVLSEKAEKLSKSKAHKALAPEALLEAHSADAIRYWTASGTLGHDTAFASDQLKNGQRLITKLWNAFRFVSEHIAQANPETPIIGTINQWIMQEASESFTSYQKQFEQHEFSSALDAVEQFFWKSFCDNYLEIIKHQLFNESEYSQEEVAATRATLYHIGLRILQLYAPYLPHVTEQLYLQLYQKQTQTSSLHQTKFTTIQKAKKFNNVKENMQILLNIIGTVRKLKTNQQLSLKTPITLLTVFAQNTKQQNFVTAHKQLLKGITQATNITCNVETDKKSMLQQDGETWNANIAL